MALVERNLYFSSTPVLNRLPFDSIWTDISAANGYTGIYDVPSGSADFRIQVDGNWAWGSPADLKLFGQWIFPDFTGMSFEGPFGPILNPPYIWLEERLGVRTSFSYSIISGLKVVPQPVCIWKIFKFDNSLRYYGTVPTFGGITLNPGAANILPFTGESVGFNAFGTNLTAPDPTDFLVVEIGVYNYGGSGSFPPTEYTALIQVGDAHEAYVGIGSTSYGNSGFILTWIGTLNGSGGWQLSEV